MGDEKIKEQTLIDKLSAKLPEEAIQRTSKEQTKKGYDTTGYSYQYCVNRLNDILGEKWGYGYHILKEITGAYKSGQPFFDVTVELSIWINDKENARICVGGHTSATFADALKGAITNAFKKTAAFWGIGKEAYEGSIDDDNKPLPDSNDNINNKKTTQTTAPAETKEPQSIDIIAGGPRKGKKWSEQDSDSIIGSIKFYQDLIKQKPSNPNNPKHKKLIEHLEGILQFRGE